MHHGGEMRWFVKLVVCFPVDVAANDRLALLIGNSDYPAPHVAQLPSCVNDVSFAVCGNTFVAALVGRTKTTNSLAPRLWATIPKMTPTRKRARRLEFLRHVYFRVLFSVPAAPP